MQKENEVKSNVPDETNWLKEAKKREIMYNLTLPKYNYWYCTVFHKQTLALLFPQNTLRIYQRMPAINCSYLFSASNSQGEYRYDLCCQI